MCNSFFHRPFRTMLPGVLVFGIALLAFASSACISRHPAGIAPSTTPLPSLLITVLGSVEASSCKWSVLFIPVSGKITPGEIIEQLILENGGAALIGVTVEHRITLYPFVVSDCSVVKGLAVKGEAS